MEEVSDLNALRYPSDDCSPLPDRFSDADVGDSSPASSSYSSCDGSDFDRYCSANSVLGSASICSSIGNYSAVGDELPSEFCSSRGKSLTNRWNEFECFSDRGAETPTANGDSFLNRTNASSSLNNDSIERSLCHVIRGEDDTAAISLAKGNELSSSSSVNYFHGASLDEYVEKYEEEGILKENLFYRNNETHLDLNTNSLMGIEANQNAFLSESEDSILDYEADSESRLHFGERSFTPVDKTKQGDVSPLFINSSVAFGSNDWDEFTLDSAAGDLASVSLHPGQSFQHKDEHIGKGFEKDFENKMAYIAVSSYEAENSTVQEVPVGDYASEINLDSQVIDIHTAKNSEYVSTLGLQNILSENNKVKWNLNSMPDDVENPIRSSHGEDIAGKGIDEASEKTLEVESELSLSSISTSRDPVQSYCRLNEAKEEIRRHELDNSSYLLPLISTIDNSSIQMDQRKDPSSPHLAREDIQEGEFRKVDIFDSYDEMVLEMEEILLDSRKSHGSMNMQVNESYMSQQSRNFRDGSSVASTSATDDIYSSIKVSSKIDRVEVIGAKQKKGDVSFGERLVGVREYTIYQMQVWSGTDVWKVERRYRDFFTLYRQLKAFFSGHGLSLPSVWSSVEQESRKVFGNASPNVITERSILIEDCLRSILNCTFHFGIPSPLTIFLTPGKIMIFNSGLFQSLVPQYLQNLAEGKNSYCSEARPEDVSRGKTISLVVEIKPHKSLRQLLEIQQYACAGCHRRLDAGRTLFRELVQTFGWNRPRFCEYTGQLFCASCHTNDTSVLPARVLHHWDFTKYSVSQLAKAYLESIYDQPMLCVSAVNPFLFSRVPALLQVMGFRKKIGAKFPYVNCSFKSSIQRSLGFRRHLLESNDFFALRDLVDLSKGPFAVLPVMVENISDLILEHITQQCLICYDSGVPCAARQACHDPSSLIFPFQEAEAEKCTSCGSIFHKACYLDLLGCPCLNSTALSKRLNPRERRIIDPHSGPAELVQSSIQPLVSNSVAGFFTNILTKARSDIWKPKNSSPVILMGSLPSSSI